MTAAFILSELQSVGTPEKAVHLSRFFKTGPGQYGEGDQFLGVVVPQTRSIAKANKATPFDELQLLLDSPWHEARLCALLILVYRFQDRKAMPEEREAIFRFYLKNMRRCNNWDLVDLTCRDIVGEYLVDKDRSLLYRLAESENLWEQRISIVSTWAFIRRNDFGDTLELSERLIGHKHDLMHKAVGWMLREVGNKQSTVSAYIYLFLSDASAKKLVIDNMKSVFDLTLTEDSDTVLKCVQDADAIAQQFTQMEQQGETIKTKDAATYADILQQTYGVKKYTGENPYKPYAGHKDPTDIEFDQRVVLTGDGQAAVQEEYSGDISSMTDYLYGLKGDMVAQYSYYETPSKESADKLMEAKAFGNNMVRESDTVIKVVNTGKDMQDLLNTYKGYSVIKDNSVKEYTRMIEETFFSTVCE